MAYEKTVWFSNQDRVCLSKADAELEDARHAISSFADQARFSGNYGDLGDFLTENCKELRPLLQSYAEAVAARNAEAAAS